MALMNFYMCLSSHFTFIQTKHILINIHPNHRNFTLRNVTPPPVSQEPMKWMSFDVCHISLSYITCFDINLIHQRIQTTHSHGSHCHHCHCCHYCNVDFVFFHNGTCHTNSMYLASMLTLHTSLISHALWLPHT